MEKQQKQQLILKNKHYWKEKKKFHPHFHVVQDHV